MSICSSILNDFRLLYWRRAFTAVTAVFMLWAALPLHAQVWAPEPNVADDTGNWSSMNVQQLDIRLDGFRGYRSTYVLGINAAKLHHPQHIVRLPNKVGSDGLTRAYFAITVSNRFYREATIIPPREASYYTDGIWLVAEVDADAYDSGTDEIFNSPGSDGRYVYEEHFSNNPEEAAKEYADEIALKGSSQMVMSTIGDWTHPAKMTAFDGILVMVGQNWSPVGTTGSSLDAVLFYDVRDPVHPKFLGLLDSVQLGIPEGNGDGGKPASWRKIDSIGLAKSANGTYHLGVQNKNFFCHESRDCFTDPTTPGKWVPGEVFPDGAFFTMAGGQGDVFHSKELYDSVPAADETCYGMDGTRYPGGAEKPAECLPAGTPRIMRFDPVEDSVLPNSFQDLSCEVAGEECNQGNQNKQGIPSFYTLKYYDDTNTQTTFETTNSFAGPYGGGPKNKFFAQFAGDCAPGGGIHVNARNEPLIYCVSESIFEPVDCPEGIGECNRLWQNVPNASPGFGVITFTDTTGAKVTYRGRGLHDAGLLSEPPWGPGRNLSGTAIGVDWKTTLIAQIEVVSGTWMIYDDINFGQGGAVRFLPPGIYDGSVSSVNSFRVRPEQGISLFEHANFFGRMLNNRRSNASLQRACGDSHAVCAALARDDCNIFGCDYPRSFDDKTSSLIVSDNRWSVYPGLYYLGGGITDLDPGNSHTVPFIGTIEPRANDAISSVRATCALPAKPAGLRYTIEQDKRPLVKWDRVPYATSFEVVIVDANDVRVREERRFALYYMPDMALEPGTYRFSVRAVEDNCAVSGAQVSGPSSDQLTLVIPSEPPPPPPKLFITTAGSPGTVGITPDPVPRIGVAGRYHPVGSILTLTATPGLQSLFVEWTGDAASCGAALTCQMMMPNADANVTAVFKLKPLLYLGAQGDGTVAKAPQGSACASTHFGPCDIYSPGAVVTLTAAANPRSQFLRWDGDPDCSDGSVTMDESKTCTAVFDKTDYQLVVRSGVGGVVKSNPLGAIDCGPDCIETYPAGGGQQSMLLVATPNPGFVFVRWYGDAQCWDEGKAGQAQISVTVGATDVSCNARFVAEGAEYALTVEKYGVGAGTVTAAATPAADSSGIDCPLRACSQDYPVNTMVQLTATTVRGSVFAGWDGDADCVDGEVTMTANIRCSARFTAKILLVDGSADGSSSGPRTEYISVLNTLNDTDYDEWSVKSPSSTSRPYPEPTALDLAPYSRVIWFTGTAETAGGGSPAAGPSPAAEASLAEYLDGGGCLFLSSPQYFHDRGLTPFAQQYFGVSAVTPDVAATQVTGAGLLPGFSSLGSLPLRFDDAGLGTVSTKSDAITAGAAPDIGLLLSYGAEGNAAVGRDNGVYRTAFLGFPFLALRSGNDRNNVMGTFLDHCLQIDRDDQFEVNDDFDLATGQQGTTDLTDLKIFPGNDDYFRWGSDWNGDTRFRIAIAHASGDLALEVYDNTRQLIASSQSLDDNEQIIVHADVDQRYFVRVHGIDSAANSYALDISAVGPPDLDGDGIGDLVDDFPDDPLLALNSFEDPDLDGFSNLEELLAGTDSLDSNSTPTSPPAPTALNWLNCDDMNACTSDFYLPDGGCTHTPVPMCRASGGDLCFPIKTKSGTVSMICL